VKTAGRSVWICRGATAIMRDTSVAQMFKGTLPQLIAVITGEYQILHIFLVSRWELNCSWANDFIFGFLFFHALAVDVS
jgi:hypothetical protein